MPAWCHFYIVSCVCKFNLLACTRMYVQYMNQLQLTILIYISLCMFIEGCAVVFFFSYWTYMVLTSWISPLLQISRNLCQQHSLKCRSKNDIISVMKQGELQPRSLLQLIKSEFTWSLALRQLLTVFCGLDLIIFTIMSKLTRPIMIVCTVSKEKGKV